MPHDKHENDEDGDPNRDEAPESEFANSVIILAASFEFVVEVDIAEKMLSEEKVRKGTDKERSREENGAEEEKLPVGFPGFFFLNDPLNFPDIKDLWAVEKGPQQGGLGPMRAEDGEAQDQGNRTLLDSKQSGGVGANTAILLPEVEGQSSSQQNRGQAHYGEEVQPAVPEKEPDSIAKGQGQRYGKGLYWAQVPRPWVFGVDSLRLKLLQNRRIITHHRERHNGH